MQCSLQQALTEGNGKVAHLKAVYQQYCGTAGFVQNLLTLAKAKAHQKAASWLLKHHVEQSNSLRGKEILTLADIMQNVYDWQSRLQLLQILPLISISQEAHLLIENFVRESLSSDNKFVRAWAIQGMYELSRQRPDLQREVLFLCEKAMLAEAPSVKARVRKILAQINKP